MYVGVMPQQQPFNMTANGGASLFSTFRPPVDGHGMHHVLPNTGLNPMMMQYHPHQQHHHQQQQQHQQNLHHQQYQQSPRSVPEMQHNMSAAHNPPPPEGLVIGVAHPRANPGVDDPSERDPIDPAHNNEEHQYEYHATPRRFGMEPNGEAPHRPGSAVAARDGNLRHQRIDIGNVIGNGNGNGNAIGNRALTPFRHHGRGGVIPPRRVSFSPMVLSLPLSPVDDATVRPDEEEEDIVSTV
eukprot:jgi/Psemu1/327089/estExt_fgenesh1_pg.C_5410001